MTPSQDAFCDKCGYIGPSQPYGQHNRPKDGQPCNYMACATQDAREGDVAFLRAIAECAAQRGPIQISRETGASMLEVIERLQEQTP